MQPFPLSFGQIANAVPILGALVLAILAVCFFWYLAEYTFTRGDDAKRTHAKNRMLDITIYLLFALIIWWIAGLL